MKLLLIEDNPAMQASLQRSLQRRGIEVALCGDGRQALDAWAANAPDVVLLDLTLPGLDGLQVLQKARQAGFAAPVIILTARGTVGDRVLGLKTGADDYLPKPFDLDELEARVRALHRRSQSSSATKPGSAAGVGTLPAFGGLRADPDSGAVYFEGQALDLAPREAALLRALLERPGRAIAKEQLLERVFPHADEIQPDAVEVVVYRLRKKIAHLGVELVTLRGLGYLLKAPA
ncbi:response regulator transcription factor [Serpentinimonas raichei]|uniref:response regulator transcription factor n=1 Tax=Serpentinimonas barnesii TaxID=1458427 RepID=UPI0004986A1A